MNHIGDGRKPENDISIPEFVVKMNHDPISFESNFYGAVANRLAMADSNVSTINGTPSKEAIGSVSNGAPSNALIGRENSVKKTIALDNGITMVSKISGDIIISDSVVKETHAAG